MAGTLGSSDKPKAAKSLIPGYMPSGQGVTPGQRPSKQEAFASRKYCIDVEYQM
jgi:hypothetical protein